ncbi:MAG: DegQ family serine endoprotease [Methyloligellaceae bacterium]
MIRRESCGSVGRALLAVLVLLVLALPLPASARTSLLDESRGVITVAPIIEQAAPAVVNISVRTRIPGTQNPLYRDPFFRHFFGLPDEVPEREAMSAGSGVIVDAEKGYVLTNHHVIDHAIEITIKLKDGRQFKGKRIGSDPGTDIGLIKIEPDNLTAISIGDSDQLKVGDFVIAIGNPFGLGQTVTSGIVSAIGRSGLSRDKYENFIQTDAPINPGNSGGALINSKGELVGINTAIIAPGGGNVGIGFAVPANMARAVMDQLIRHGEVRRGRIGVAIQDITPDIAKALALPTRHGALVSKVEPGSPAEKAGLRPGDAIVELNGRPLRDGNDLRNKVGLLERGSKVTLTIIRKGERKKVTVRVGKIARKVLAGDAAIPQLAGVKITEIPASHPRKGEVKGVLVAEVETGSPAWRLGLRSGDIILSVNQRKVTSVEEFEQAAKATGGVLALEILRGDTTLFLILR